MKSIAYDFKAERQNQFMALLCQLELLGFNTGCVEVESWNQVNYESIVDSKKIKDFLKVCDIWSQSK